MTTLKIGTRITWKTNNRWGESTKAGRVVAFCPRNHPAKKMLTAEDAKAFRGIDRSSLNDRYLVRGPTGHITAPRAKTIHRSTQKQQTKRKK